MRNGMYSVTLGDTELIEWYEERAAIFEFDAGYCRAESQRLAYWELRRHFGRIPVPKEIQDWTMEGRKNGSDSRAVLGSS